MKLALAIDLQDIPQIERFIEEQGADVDSCDEFGRTQLMCAVMPDDLGDFASFPGLLKTVQVLLRLSADKNAVYNSGRTAHDYANQYLDSKWVDEYGHSAIDRLTPENVETVREICKLLQ